MAIDYSTEAVLHTIRRLLAVQGDVQMIISDPGSQLVGASSEMTEWRKIWDSEQLTQFGASRGLEWRTIMPNAQRKNGAAEVMIRMIDRVISNLKGHCWWKLI